MKRFQRVYMYFSMFWQYSGINNEIGWSGKSMSQNGCKTQNFNHNINKYAGKTVNTTYWWGK